MSDKTAVYFGSMESNSEAQRLLPSPNVNINYEPVYANDNIIGMRKVISLNGKITEYKYPALDSAATVISVYEGLRDLQGLLGGKDGNCLTVRASGGDIMLSACGGKLRSLNFEESPNAWARYVPYSAEIEFDYIEFLGENRQCNNFWDNESYDSNLVDIDKYPLKSFNDSWSIVLDEQSFNYIDKSDTQDALQICNQVLNITYNISAEGSNAYQPGTDIFKPGWETAKHFVQNRLYKQVTELLSGVLSKDGTAQSNCEAGRNPSSLHTPNGNGVLQQLDGLFEVYNEKVSCSSSELNGTFTATYTAILKINAGGSFDDNKILHTVNKNISYSSPNTSHTQSEMTINGSIQGLILGGLIKTPAYSFQLPNNGALLIKATSTEDAYENANTFWDRITDPVTGDIIDQFKESLGIKYDEFPKGTDNAFGLNYPPARSASLTRNYIEGTIDYNLTFSDKPLTAEDSYLDYTVHEVSVSFKDRVPIFAEFVIPDSKILLQDINTYTGKEVSYTITGRDKSLIIDMTTTLQSQKILDIANKPVDIPSILDSFPEYKEDGIDFIEKTKSISCNCTDGSYSINITYVCATGCLGGL